MPIVSAVRTSATTPASARKLNFAGFNPSTVTISRPSRNSPEVSGIHLEGMLNRSENATIDWSAKKGFTVSGKTWTGKPFLKERPMTKSEMVDLKKQLAKLPDHGAEQLKYPAIIAKLDQAISPAKPFTAAQLKNVLGAWEFQHAQYSGKKPAGFTADNFLKTTVLSKPPAGMVGGSSMIAHQLKSNPDQIVFEKVVSGRPFYLGPVSGTRLPK